MDKRHHFESGGIPDITDIIEIACFPLDYPEFYKGNIGLKCSVDTDAIKDTFAYRLLFGKANQNNWRKLHGLPMRRRK